MQNANNNNNNEIAERLYCKNQLTAMKHIAQFTIAKAGLVHGEVTNEAIGQLVFQGILHMG